MWEIRHPIDTSDYRITFHSTEFNILLPSLLMILTFILYRSITGVIQIQLERAMAELMFSLHIICSLNELTWRLWSEASDE